MRGGADPLRPADAGRLKQGVMGRSGERVTRTEPVSILLRARTREDDPPLASSSATVAPAPGSLVIKASRAAGKEVGEPERRWLVEVEVDLRGANLDPERWLRHCHSFLVDSESGEKIGVVDDVELASGSDQAVALVVACGWFGRHIRTIAVADVEAIVPGERRLIVTDAAAQAARAARRRP